MEDGTKFCMVCGSPLEQPQMQPASQVNAQTQAPVEPQPQPAPQAQTQAPVQPQPQPQPAPQAQAHVQPQQNVQPQQGVYMNTPLEMINQEPPKKKKKKGGIIAIVAILLIALIGGGGFFGYKQGWFDSILNPEPVVADEPEEPEPEPEPVIEETQAKQTIMLYIIGSNLESEGGLATDDLEEISRATLTDDTNIIIQTGGCTHWNNSFCNDDEVQRFCYKDGKFNELDNLGTVSMANIDALTDFITFAADEYPADDYVLILWDHGGGVPVGYGVDENFPDDMIYDYQLGHGIAKTGVHFDSIVFDACNMCTLEVGMSLKDVADYMIGAESYVNGNGLAYTNWLDPSQFVYASPLPLT